MKNILFVDDEKLVLQALQRSLNPMHRVWNMRFADSGTEALRLLAEQSADAVVSDMRMPQMNGAQLLNEVLRLHPRTVRVILSGFSDQELIMQCLSGTHQFLSKPCNSEMLTSVVARALEMDSWINNEKLKTLVGSLNTLPSMPTLYFQIVKELGSPHGTLEKVGTTIAKDPAMTVKILQLVNSAFFGLRRELTDPVEAVLQLGLETIKSLVLGIHVFAEYESWGRAEISVQRLWHHSLATAGTARRIAQYEQQSPGVIEESFTAGLLHDIGRLVLMANLPAEYAEAMRRSRTERISMVDAERAVFGASHAEVGGYLLGLWGLPISLVETTIFHHYPRECHHQSFGPLAIVHVANVLEQDAGPVLEPARMSQLDREYLTQIGMWDRAQFWWKLPGLAAHPKVAA